ncbi:MAG: response regulator [Clostridiales bacterium]|nr:response regulator [Clostridiales bacterium]
MLRVMLVDDEQMGLEGLRLLIDWQQEGFEICGEYRSASDALAALSVDPPHLIVTDIRMAGMDGIAMMNKAKELGYKGQLIVVSGYSDFDYALQALKLGVAGYLLKPIDAAEANSVLEHVRQKLIISEKLESNAFAEHQRHMTGYLAGRFHNFPKVDHQNSWQLGTWGAPMHYEAVRELVILYPSGMASTHIVDDKEFFLLGWNEEEVSPDLTILENALSRSNRTFVKTNITNAPSELQTQCQLLAEKSTADSAQLISMNDQILSAIATRQREPFIKLCDQLMAYCASAGAKAKTDAKQFFVMGCSRLLANRQEDIAVFLDAQHEDIKTLGLLAIDLLQPPPESISDLAIQYVNAHPQSILTLDTIAVALGYNSTYLGRVFREEQGIGFREWQHNRRIKHAAMLLRTTNRSIQSISDEVGYTQYKRFLSHFKQRYGQTPEQYRRSSRTS